MRNPVLAALDALTDEPDLVAALWASFAVPALAQSAGRQGSARLVWTITRSAPFRDDFLFRVSALAVLGVLGGPHARAALAAEAYAGPPLARPYSALALAGNVRAESVPALTALLHASDPFERMAGQRALLSVNRGATAVAAHSALLSIALGGGPTTTRIAALECLTATGLQASALPVLRRIAGDDCESHTVRGAAIRALGRLGDMLAVPSLEQWALTSLSPAVRWAAIDALQSLGRAGHHSVKLAAAAGVEAAHRALRPPLPPRIGAHHLAQFVTSGTGGVSTLTADLHNAFSRRPDVGRVTTVTWGGAARAGTSVAEPIAAEDEGPPAWDATIRIERALDHVFQSGLPHLIHLRFADVGTMAAARWAERRGVPVYFTFAPDPIMPMRMATASGLLARETFAEADARERFIARTSILHALARSAEGIALLPRTDGAVQSLRSDTFAGHSRTIAEGIDIDVVTRARVPENSARLTLERAWSPGYGRGFRPERRGLPVLVSVGRLHPIKGLARLVEAWAGDGSLGRTVNVVIFGGSLDEPDDTERAVLDDVERIVAARPEVAGGILLAGTQPHDRVAGLLAALRDGIPGLTAPRAIYVCPSAKEEFGLAILEAMAVGLPVVGPNRGGPATYLQDGELGFLADTTDAGSLAGALHHALALRNDIPAYEAMSARGRLAVRTHFAVDRMAADLMALYQEGAAARLASAS